MDPAHEYSSLPRDPKTESRPGQNGPPDGILSLFGGVSGYFAVCNYYRHGTAVRRVDRVLVFFSPDFYNTSMTHRQVRPRFWGFALLFLAVIVVGVSALSDRGIKASAAGPLKPHPITPPVARWNTTSLHLPLPLQGLSAGAAGHEVYVAGGLNTQSQSTVWELSGHRFKPMGALVQPVHDAAMVISGQYLYMVGGGSLVSTPSIQEMRLGAGHASRLVTPLPVARSDLNAVLWRAHAYLIGGHAAGAPSRIVWRYSLGGRAVMFTRLPVGVRYAAAARWHDHVYVIGGLTSGGVTNQAVEINLTTGQVERLPSYPRALQYAEAFVLQGTLWVAGGRTASGWTQDTFRWDPTRHRWLKGPPLPMAAGYGAVVAVNSRQALWFGGRTAGHPIDAVWKFTD